MTTTAGRIGHPHRLSLKELLNVYSSKKELNKKKMQQGCGIKEPKADSVADELPGNFTKY